MWQVQVKSLTYQFGIFLIQRNKKEQSLPYSTTFQDHFKIVRALPQLHKNYKIFYRSNSRWCDAFFDPETSWPQT